MNKRRMTVGIILTGGLLLLSGQSVLSETAEVPVLTVWVDSASQYPVRMACYSYYYGLQGNQLQSKENQIPELSWQLVDKSDRSPEQLAQELESAIKAGTGPDVIYLDEANAVDRVRAMEEGWFLELDGMERLYEWEFDYSDGMLAAGQYEGRQYILPLFAEYPVVFGVKQELEAAGIDTQDQSSDLEQFLHSLLDASERSGKLIFDDAAAVDWIEECCFSTEMEPAERKRFDTLLKEVRVRSGSNGDFFSPYTALDREGYLLSGCSLSNKFQTAQNLALLDTESVVFLSVPSWNGEICPVITHAAAINANARYPEEAKAFLQRFQTTFVSQAGETEDYPAMRNDEFYDNQLPWASGYAENSYCREYASQATAFYSDAGCNQSFLNCVRTAEGKAVFHSAEKNAQQPKNVREVITVAYCDSGMRDDHVVSQWLQSAAAQMQEVYVQLIPFQSGAFSVYTDQMEQAGVGPDVLLSAAHPMESYGIAGRYMDLSGFAADQNLILAEIDGVQRGLVYGVRKETERSYVFTISKASEHKEASFEFCIRALKDHLYPETMERIGLERPTGE